jgi:hypothetical protein
MYKILTGCNTMEQLKHPSKNRPTEQSIINGIEKLIKTTIWRKAYYFLSTITTCSWSKHLIH